MRGVRLLVLAVLLLAGGARPAFLQRDRPVRVFTFEVVRSYPHDAGAFTQGLIYRDGFLYESTGLNGQSSLRRVRLETGEVLQKKELARRYFAEGLAEFNGELFQLTWDTKVGFVYDRQTFEPKRTFQYRGEGWGLTYDGGRLIMSDGSATLRYLDPATMAESGRISVTDRGVKVTRLNELEYIKGRIYANVWFTDRIAIIDPATGHVTAWVDLAGLMAAKGLGAQAVLNGIAYDAAGDRLFVTGKMWPRLFEIRLKEGPGRWT